MLLKYIFIKEYKKFKNFELKITPTSDFNSIYREYYGNMNVSTFVGENGVGKTTLLSFIVNVFHNLERYHDKIHSDFIIKYDIKKGGTGENLEVQIRKEQMNIYIKFSESDQECLLLEWTHIRGGEGVYKRKATQENIEKPDITYDGIKEYLPYNLITSVFSLHSEYETGRPNSYYGDRLIKDYDITNIYGADHFKGSSLSRGLARFLGLYITQNEILISLLNSLNLELAPVIKIYLDRNIGSNESEFGQLNVESGWVDLGNIDNNHSNEEWIRKIVDAEYDEDIYINDLAFYKEDYVIDLSTMSSGEKMFFYRIFSILSVIDHNSLIIIEEPELHLNPTWTKQIITMFYLLFNTYNSHFLIATHSYSFINTLFPENIILFKQYSVTHPNFNTFLSNEREITSKLFHSSKNLNYAETKLIENIKISKSDDELKYIMGYLGESFYKFMIFNELHDGED
ncbi:AAA family ATPase [Salsuginibacillus kocurii]|uniref:AAA family ATPase n=1 Tax=Salsuginibacillus kocurii TaxID=427078 RepID=UPI000365BC7A|nr:AAA family ATPase [Salsuginibacillus kocurii]